MNRFRICRILAKLGTSSVAIVALAAVGGAPARAQTEHTVFAIPAVSIQFLAGYVADDSQLWEKQGLEVKTPNIAGVGSINAVISNSVDFAMSTGPSITRAYARGRSWSRSP